MQIDKAKNILGLSEDFTQKELIRAYKENIAENDLDKTTGDQFETFSDAANHLYDISTAYLLLRDQDNLIDQENDIQPLAIFTDASVRKKLNVASFGIVAINVERDFQVPEALLKKYNIESHLNNSGNCHLTGLIVNYNSATAEIMGIIAALEIFAFLASDTLQKIIFYTDSLIAKKVLSDKRMPLNSKLYSNFRQNFIKIKNLFSLEIVIKKVAAHKGIESNEIADQLAKERLDKY